jgi:hypothetical protein
VVVLARFERFSEKPRIAIVPGAFGGCSVARHRTTREFIELEEEQLFKAFYTNIYRMRHHSKLAHRGIDFKLQLIPAAYLLF